MFGLKKRTWAIGGIAVALLGTAAFATLRDHSPEARAERVTERVTDRLELNNTQKQAFSKIANSFVEMRGAGPEFMLDLSGKLKELAGDETLTVEEVNVLRAQIKAEFDRRADVLVPEFVAFYNTLDNAQREQVMARLDKFSDRMERRLEHKK